jgi:hypothetical protein
MERKDRRRLPSAGAIPVVGLQPSAKGVEIEQLPVFDIFDGYVIVIDQGVGVRAGDQLHDVPARIAHVRRNLSLGGVVLSPPVDGVAGGGQLICERPETRGIDPVGAMLTGVSDCPRAGSFDELHLLLTSLEREPGASFSPLTGPTPEDRLVEGLGGSQVAGIEHHPRDGVDRQRGYLRLRANAKGMLPGHVPVPTIFR